MSIEEQARIVRWDGPEDRVQAIAAFGHAVRRDALEEASKLHHDYMEVLDRISAEIGSASPAESSNSWMVTIQIDRNVWRICQLWWERKVRAVLPKPVVAVLDAVDLEERND